jgi:LacI family repressor for deo operon, udp, cdd, tsx, nupC, and nupG
LNKPAKQRHQTPPATIREVAVDLGLSVATVSRALTRPELLKEKTRVRVLEAVERLGYQPNLIARGLRLRESRLVFVVVPSLSPFFLEVFRGVERAARECDYAVLMGHTERMPDREQMFFDQVASGRADGVILVSSSDAEGIATRTRRMPPVVAALENIEGQPIPAVRVDHITAAMDATNHLLSLGHRRIAHIAGPCRSPMAVHRREGFEQAMIAAGQDPDAFPRLNGPFTVAFGTQAMTTILALKDRPTAIFAANDEIAVGAIQAIKHAGLKVGHDISVIGFDDQRIANLYEPPLTTIRVPTEEIGYQSMLVLQKILAGGSGFGCSVLATEIVVRATTGPPPGA